MTELSLDQQAKLKHFEYVAQEMSKEELAKLVIDLIHQNMIQKATYQELIGKAWGIGEVPFAMPENEVDEEDLTA